METLQLACEILAVVNVVLWSLNVNLYMKRRERKSLNIMRRERQLFLDTMLANALEAHKFATAKMIARITKKKMVLA